MDKKITDLYKGGYTGRQIAKIVGASYSYVYKIIKKHSVTSGLPTQNFRLDLNTDEMASLRSEGLSICQIARRVGCSSTCVANRLRVIDEMDRRKQNAEI